MSLAKQYFDDRIASIRQQDYSFSRTEKKIQITTNTLRAFQLLGAIIFSASGQIHFGLKFFQHRLENYFGR